jgi:hypothetical protein
VGVANFYSSYIKNRIWEPEKIIDLRRYVHRVARQSGNSLFGTRQRSISFDAGASKMDSHAGAWEPENVGWVEERNPPFYMEWWVAAKGIIKITRFVMPVKLFQVRVPRW